MVAYTLGHEPPDDLTPTTTLEERLAMMRPLALAAWSVAGLDSPRAVRAGRMRGSQAKG